MLQRKVLKKLIEWKNRSHKCLVVKSQRQVGKTFILEYFGSTEYTNYVKLDMFKVYMSDTGMLMNMMGPESRAAIMMGDTSFDMGAVTENAVAEALMKSGCRLYYFRKTNGTDKMELDMVIEHDGLVAIEVKKGEHRDYPSLKKTLGNENVARRVIFEKSNVYTDEQRIEHYPLFASAFIFPTEGSESLDRLMEGVIRDPYS